MSIEADIDELSDALTSLVRLMHRPKAWENVVKHAGVTLDRPGAAILHYISQCESGHSDCNVQHLAAQLSVEAPSVSRKVQELEQDGLLTRHPNKDDRRAVVLRTSAKGRKSLERIQRAKREMLLESLQGWSAHDRRELIRLFQRFAETMNNPEVKGK